LLRALALRGQTYHNGELQRHLDEARKRVAALERENKDYLTLLQETQIGAHRER